MLSTYYLEQTKSKKQTHFEKNFLKCQFNHTAQKRLKCCNAIVSIRSMSSLSQSLISFGMHFNPEKILFNA